MMMQRGSSSGRTECYVVEHVVASVVLQVVEQPSTAVCLPSGTPKLKQTLVHQ
jgi:hypothetical protein